MSRNCQKTNRIFEHCVGNNNFRSDIQKKRLFIKETIYILFRLESLSAISDEYVAGMKSKITGSNQGCFLLMVGIYNLTKGSFPTYEGDLQSSLTCYVEAHEVFAKCGDDLFILLTTRLICQLYESNPNSASAADYGYFNDLYKQYIKHPSFKDIRLELLFENFDRRINLAKQITKGLQDLEATFRDDQYKRSNDPNEATGLQRVSLENNKIWKQAVRLSLARSIVSAKLIIQNDREIDGVKKEQLRTVIYV